MRRRLTRLAAVVAVAPVALLAGCETRGAWVDLQDVMKKTIPKKNHRAVKSVACTPHVHQVGHSSTAHLTCLVRFKDGTSYRPSATIRNPAQGDQVSYYTYSWDSPPE